MNCDRCGTEIPAGEEMDHQGQVLCEDCAMRALSPAKACDPWAVRSAQTLSHLDDAYSALSETQVEILRVLKETSGAEPGVLAQRVGLKLPELEREIATLRHMEKIRGKLRAGQIIICLWDA